MRARLFLVLLVSCDAQSAADSDAGSDSGDDSATALQDTASRDVESSDADPSDIVLDSGAANDGGHASDSGSCGRNCTGATGPSWERIPVADAIWAIGWAYDERTDKLFLARSSTISSGTTDISILENASGCAGLERRWVKTASAFLGRSLAIDVERSQLLLIDADRLQIGALDECREQLSWSSRATEFWGSVGIATIVHSPLHDRALSLGGCVENASLPYCEPPPDYAHVLDIEDGADWISVTVAGPTPLLIAQLSHAPPYDPISDRLIIASNTVDEIWYLESPFARTSSPSWSSLTPLGDRPAIAGTAFNPDTNQLIVTTTATPDLYVLDDADGSSTPAWRPLSMPASGPAGGRIVAYDRVSRSLFVTTSNDLWVAKLP